MRGVRWLGPSPRVVSFSSEKASCLSCLCSAVKMHGLPPVEPFAGHYLYHGQLNLVLHCACKLVQAALMGILVCI